MEKEYKTVLPQLDQGEAKSSDEMMRYIREKMSSLSKQYKNHMSQSY